MRARTGEHGLVRASLILTLITLTRPHRLQSVHSFQLPNRDVKLFPTRRSLIGGSRLADLNLSSGLRRVSYSRFRLRATGRFLVSL